MSICVEYMNFSAKTSESIGETSCNSGGQMLITAVILMRTKPKIYLMLGFPGSGKSTFSKKLAAQLELPRFSLDEEYFRRVPNVQQEERDFAVEGEVESSIRVRVTDLVKLGTSVVLDFCPWQRARRLELYEFIRSIGAEPFVYHLDVPRAELLQRLDARNAEKDPAHQFMTPSLLTQFEKQFDDPESDEPVQRMDPTETAPG